MQLTRLDSIKVLVILSTLGCSLAAELSSPATPLISAPSKAPARQDGFQWFEQLGDLVREQMQDMTRHHIMNHFTRTNPKQANPNENSPAVAETTTNNNNQDIVSWAESINSPASTNPLVSTENNGARSLGGVSGTVAGSSATIDSPLAGILPLDNMRQIAVKMNIPFDEIVDNLQKQMLIGLEQFLRPMASGMKLVEQLFSPDPCHLRTLCTYGSQLNFGRPILAKLPMNIFEESQILSSLQKGVMGNPCTDVYVCKNPQGAGIFGLKNQIIN